ARRQTDRLNPIRRHQACRLVASSSECVRQLMHGLLGPTLGDCRLNRERGPAKWEGQGRHHLPPIASAIWPAMALAAARAGLTSTWAYRCVVAASAWPSSLPIVSSDMPSPAPTEA